MCVCRVSDFSLDLCYTHTLPVTLTLTPILTHNNFHNRMQNDSKEYLEIGARYIIFFSSHICQQCQQNTTELYHLLKSELINLNYKHITLGLHMKTGN